MLLVDWQRIDMFPEHPEPGGERPEGEAHNVVDVEGSAGGVVYKLDLV